MGCSTAAMRAKAKAKFIAVLRQNKRLEATQMTESSAETAPAKKAKQVALSSVEPAPAKKTKQVVALKIFGRGASQAIGRAWNRSLSQRAFDREMEVRKALGCPTPRRTQSCRRP